MSARGSQANWEQTITATTAEQTFALAGTLAAALSSGDLVVLTGELGAGKTTFTQGLGEGLGVRAGIISPTFVLVRIHPNLAMGPRPGGPDLVHVDAYRLGSAAEIDDIDLENTMDSSVTVVEWGRDRVEHLSDSRLEIDLHRAIGLDGALDFDSEETDEPRTIVLRGYGPRWVSAPDLVAATPEPDAEGDSPC